MRIAQAALRPWPASVDQSILEWQAMALIERGDTAGARALLKARIAAEPGPTGAPSAMCIDLIVATYEWDFDIDAATRAADRLMRAYPIPSRYGVSAILSRAGLALNIGDYDVAAALLAATQQKDAALDFDTVAWFLQLKSHLEVQKGNYPAAVHLAHQSADIARAVSRGLDRSARLANTNLILLECGLPREAAENGLAALAVSVDAGRSDPGTATFAAFVSHCLGDAAEATRLVRTALAVAPVHSSMALLRSAVGILIGLSTADTDLIAMARNDDLVERTLQSSGWYLPYATLAPYHRLYRLEARFDLAARLLRSSAKAARSLRGLWPLLFEIAEFGESDALDHAKAIVARCDQRPPLFAAHLAFFNAFVARRERRFSAAVELSETASRGFAQFGLRYLNARALEIAGRFNEAYKLYLNSGFRGDANRIAVPRRSRGRPFRDASISHWHRELCRLIADGSTNPQIAAQVGLSQRTIERRIGDLYALAGVVTRTELCTLIGRGWYP